jgi:hypothetical protein
MAVSYGVASIPADAVDTVDELMALASQRLEGGAPTPPPVGEALPAEIDEALRVLEHADASRLGDVSNEILERLRRIAKSIQTRRGTS